MKRWTFVAAARAAAWALSGLPAALAGVAQAQPDTKLLSVAEAEQLAVRAQPALAALERAADAARDAAVADRQLADPRIRAGIVNLPVTTGDAWRFDRDDQTMVAIGVFQDVVRADKRESAARRQEALADAALAEREAEARRIRRDAALAWVDAWAAARRYAVLDDSRAELAAERAVARSRVAAGGADARDVFGIDAATAAVDDQRAVALRDERRARALLARYIGRDAARPLAEPPGSAPQPAFARDTATGAATHPFIAEARAMEAVAQREAERAHIDTKLDWSWEVSYGKRFAGRSDMISLQIAVPLLWDTPNRQDRRTAEKRALAERAGLQAADRERQLAAERDAALIDWEAAIAREAIHMQQLAPATTARLDTTLAAYGAGKVGYAAVADARRAVIDTHVHHIELRADVAKAAIALRYFE